MLTSYFSISGNASTILTAYVVAVELTKVPMETPEVMRALVLAHRHLAELKGVVKTMPNEGILLSSLSLQEAQSSSAIENIITTQDALFKHELQAGKT